MTTATIYYDTQDSSNQGWAYRIAGGESGALDCADDIRALIDNIERDGALDAVVSELPTGVYRLRIIYAEDHAPVDIAV